MSDKIDLYDDYGRLLKSDVDLMAIHPLKNAAIMRLINEFKRTNIVDLEKIERYLKKKNSSAQSSKGNPSTGNPSKNNNDDIDFDENIKPVPKAPLDDIVANANNIADDIINFDKNIKPVAKASLDDIVANANNIAERMKVLLQIVEGDDTNVKVLAGGKQLLVQIPISKVNSTTGTLIGLNTAASATVNALIQEFEVTKSDEARMIHAAVWGPILNRGMGSGNVSTAINIIKNDEGLGATIRNLMINDIPSITKGNALHAATLATIFDQIDEFEMGNAFGIFERHQLLRLAYQGLNADNIVYEIVNKNSKAGTIGTVVQSIIERAIEDKVIKAGKKLPSGFVMYEANDVSKWNAYAAAGILAATIVNCGSFRNAQAVSSTLLNFNDILEKETALPACDWGKVQGTAVGFSFFSHSIYGGGGPGLFNANHIVTRSSRSFAIPCVAAAEALNLGTQMVTREMTSGIFSALSNGNEFSSPLSSIAGAIR